MQEHQTNETRVEERLVTLGFFHRYFERRTGGTLHTKLVYEITSSQERVLTETVFDKDILRRNFAISKADIYFSFLITIAYA